MVEACALVRSWTSSQSQLRSLGAFPCLPGTLQILKMTEFTRKAQALKTKKDENPSVRQAMPFECAGASADQNNHVTC